MFPISKCLRFTLPETNSSHLKMDGWKTTFLLKWPLFKGHVSFRGCNLTGNDPTFDGSTFANGL